MSDPEEAPGVATTKPQCSLKKYGVRSLAQTISAKGDPPGERWSIRALGKNPDAFAAAVRARRPKSKG
jgi:hypothetical protein